MLEAKLLLSLLMPLPSIGTNPIFASAGLVLQSSGQAAQTGAIVPSFGLQPNGPLHGLPRVGGCRGRVQSLRGRRGHGPALRGRVRFGGRCGHYDSSQHIILVLGLRLVFARLVLGQQRLLLVQLSHPTSSEKSRIRKFL